MERVGLSVIVPAYQEAEVLAANLERLAARLAERGEAFEILCVDDGSTDGTAAILERLQAAGRVRALRHATNRGKGAAVRTGMAEARGELALFLDADLSTDLGDLDPLLAALDAGADVAVGSRRAPGARLERRQGRLREGLGRAFSRLARLAAALEVRDFTCGFKAFRRAAREQIFARARVDGWAFDAELLGIARARGLNVVEVPVRWSHREKSRVRVGRAIARSLVDLLAIAARRLAGEWTR